jgi:hypothetical protein
MEKRLPDGCDGIVVRSFAAGLGNRVPALAAFASIAERSNCPLYCYWCAGDDCPGLPEDVFDRSSMFWNPIGAAEYERLIAELKHPAVFPKTLTSSMPEEFTGWSGFDSVESIWIQVAKRLFSLKPAASVAKRLDDLTKKLMPRDKRIGIHVRRTDLWARGDRTNSQRDLDLYRRLDMLADEGPGSWIVASDNPESLKDLHGRYGDRIIHTGVDWTHAGIRRTTLADAALDLFALSSCSYIIGTRGSTFSTMAALVGRSKLETV